MLRTRDMSSCVRHLAVAIALCVLTAVNFAADVRSPTRPLCMRRSQLAPPHTGKHLPRLSLRGAGEESTDAARDGPVAVKSRNCPKRSQLERDKAKMKVGSSRKMPRQEKSKRRTSVRTDDSEATAEKTAVNSPDLNSEEQLGYTGGLEHVVLEAQAVWHKKLAYVLSGKIDWVSFI